MYSINIPKCVIEKTKERMRKVYAFETPDRLPVMFGVSEKRKDMSDKYWVAEFSKYVYKGWEKEETEEDFEKELNLKIYNINQGYKKFPYGEFDPVLDIKTFQEVLLLCLGVNYRIKNDGELVIEWTNEPQIKDVEKDADKLKMVDFQEIEVVSRLLNKMKYFAKKTEYKIPINSFDMQAPLSHLMKLMDTNQFMMEFYDHPEGMKQLLFKLADDVILLFRAQEEAVGGHGNLRQPFSPKESPIVIADDLVSVINPDLYIEIAAEPNSKILKEFGGGMIHTCGPIWGRYLDAVLSVEGCVNMNDVFVRSDQSRTAEDMLEIKKRLSGKIVYNTLLPLNIEEFTIDFVKRMMEGGGVYLSDSGPKEVGLRIMDIVDRASS